MQRLSRLSRIHFLVLASAAFAVVTGCAEFTQIPQTQSAIEQQLLLRALERSVEDLDTQQVAGKAVSVHLSTIAKDYQDFLKEFIEARLSERNLRIVDDPKEADERVEVFAQVLGTDRGSSLVGIPSLPTPFVNLATPEIAFYKQDAHRGRSETQLFVFDAKSDRLVGKSPVSVGESKYDNYTILMFFKFTDEDVGTPVTDS